MEELAKLRFSGPSTSAARVATAGANVRQGGGRGGGGESGGGSSSNGGGGRGGEGGSGGGNGGHERGTDLHVLVTNGELVPTVAKLILFDLFQV